jgi:hypothetical protein
LDGLRADITAALDGTLRDGTLYRRGEATDPYGNPVPGEFEQVSTFEGLRANYDAAWAAQAGIPRTDARIEMLAASLSTAPMQDDALTIEGGWWLIIEVELDPAGAWFACECRATSAIE